MKKKKKLNPKTIINILIKLFFFFTYPAIFSTAFSGVKYLCTQLAAQEAFALNSFVVTLLFVSIFTIVFGRFFCGFACAFGIYGDALYAISSFVRKKLKKKPAKIPEKVTRWLRCGKYIVLFAIVVLCLIGQSQLIAENSPWSLFSRFHAGKFSLDGYLIAFVLLLCISVGMLWEERFFCRFLCPMGAVFSLLPVLPFSALKRNRENCGKNCRACKVKCPANIEIATTMEGDNPQMGECFTCGKCVDICPKANIHSFVVRREKQGIILQLIKAALLVGFCYLLNI